MSAAPEHPPQPQQTPTSTLDPLQADTAAVSSRSDSDSSIPERLGEFRITALLGRGGMGTVYLAEQQNPVREVALKVLRGAQDDADALRRFRLEGEALALLDHPNIAHVFATGVDLANGANTPYLAMELVRGRSLLADAEARALDVEGRVRLMLAVCRGVQHAHQRGVIHRDLKPANILVDHEGRPKIMDFGIARITSGGNDAATRLTEAGQVVGTIPYMSPEQLRGETGKIDVRTDVFALGVILYELLCGKRPRDLDASSLFSAIKSAERLPMVPLVRVEAKFGGDLDTIVMKALAEERSQRYASVGELANDLERYLDHRPIEARAPSALYIAGKFARRNRALVTAAGIAVLALIAATVFSLLSANRERLARQDAERNARVTASVNDFMNSMFSAAMPQEALGRDITVKEIVDQAVKQLQLQPPADATVDAQIALSLAQVYQVLGRFDEASQLVASGIGRTEGKADLDATLLIELKMLAADLAGRKGDFKVYEQRARAAIAMVESTLGSDNLLYHKARNELAAALVYQSRHDEAAAIYESILRFPTSTPEANELHEEVQADFGVLKRDMGKYDEAEAIFTDAIAELTERLGSDHPSTLSALNNLATVRQRKGDLAGAQTDYEKALAGRIKVLGPDHPETLTVKQNLANLMILVGRQTEALPILQDLVERNRKVRGPTHPNSSIAAGALAWAYEDLGRLDEAEALYRDTLKLEAQAKSDFTEAFSTQQNFAMLLMKRDKLVEAATNFRGAIARAAPLLGDAHPYVLIYRNNYGECLTRMGRYDEALKLLRDSHSGLVTVFGADHERVKKSLARIAAAERG